MYEARAVRRPLRRLCRPDEIGIGLAVDAHTGEPHTAHTTNPVPVLLQNGRDASLADGRLADIAPTLLDLMGLPQPPEMTGTSLLRRPGNPDGTPPT